MSKDWTGNYHSIWKTIGASSHTNEERQKDDYYATDPIAVDKLLMVEMPNRSIWEPACGGGHLSERLKQYGYNVMSSDIIERGYEDMQCIDFLECDEPLYENTDILTNPPYKYAMEFVLKALELLQSGCKCYMFLKLTFLEGEKRYRELFMKQPPKSIFVFSKRVLCAKNGEFERMREGGGSAVAYAWFVWQKGYTGATEVSWI